MPCPVAGLPFPVEDPIRNAPPASSAGKFGIGESLVNTTSGPTALTAPHGQSEEQEVINDATTDAGVNAEPS